MYTSTAQVVDTLRLCCLSIGAHYILTFTAKRRYVTAMFICPTYSLLCAFNGRAFKVGVSGPVSNRPCVVTGSVGRGAK